MEAYPLPVRCCTIMGEPGRSAHSSAPPPPACCPSLSFNQPVTVTGLACPLQVTTQVDLPV